MNLKLSAPKMIVFLISLVLAVVGFLGLLGVAIPTLGISSAWILGLAYILLAAGVLFKGI